MDRQVTGKRSQRKNARSEWTKTLARPVDETAPFFGMTGRFNTLLTKAMLTSRINFVDWWGYMQRNLPRLAAGFVAMSVFLLGLAAVNFSGLAGWVAHGPIQTGHQNVDCRGCHVPAAGSVRQQLQANVAFVIGRRDLPVDYGYQPVRSEQCAGCHERPNDRHPIYRFNEPRFADVRAELAANSCLGCHSEHTAARVEVAHTVCSHCHGDLALQSDPLDVSHTTLVQGKAWGTCLGCHDFHGNHPHRPQTRMSDRFSEDVLQAYLKDGHSPFGQSKYYEAKNEK